MLLKDIEDSHLYMSMTYIQLIQQCTLAIWGGGVTLNFYPLATTPENLPILQQQLPPSN